MANRGRTARRRAKKLRAAEQQQSKEMGGSDSIGRSVAVAEVGADAIEVAQTTVAPNPQNHDEESAFAPDGIADDQLQAIVAKGRAAGLGEAAIAALVAKTNSALARRQGRWLELKAIREGWPISQAMRQRIVYESMQVITDPKASNRDKAIEKRLLIAMQHQNNNPNALPGQQEATVGGITVNQVLQFLSVSDAELDFRTVKPDTIDNDYAE